MTNITILNVCPNPEGAFYLFMNVKKRTGLGSEAFCEALFKEKKVALIPGNAFGPSGEGYVRFSYCYSLAHIKEALIRIESFIQSI